MEDHGRSSFPLAQTFAPDLQKSQIDSTEREVPGNHAMRIAYTSAARQFRDSDGPAVFS